MRYDERSWIELTSCLCSGVPSERLEYDNQGKILILLYPSIYLRALPCPPSKPFHFRPVDAEKIRTIIATTAADELIQGASGRRANKSMKVLEENVHVLEGTHHASSSLSSSSSRGTRSRLNSESSHIQKVGRVQL
eukprot:54753_1